MEELIVDNLQRVGFTGSEAKVYLALVKNQPATGYELAAVAGVPRSQIYNVLRKLESQGLAVVQEEKPARYSAMSPDELCRTWSEKYQNTFKSLGESFKQVGSKKEPITKVWYLRDGKAGLEKAKAIIAEARETLFLSLWRSEESLVLEELQKAHDRGVKIFQFSFSCIEKRPWKVFSYGFDEAKLAQFWKRQVFLLKDKSQVLLIKKNNGEFKGIFGEEDNLIDISINNYLLDLNLFAKRFNCSVDTATKELIDTSAPIDELMNLAKPIF